MSNEIKNTTEKGDEARRAFLKKAGKLAVVVPVTSLLVAAKSKGAKAALQVLPYSTGPGVN